jgi:hypothetical protein
LRLRSVDGDGVVAAGVVSFAVGRARHLLVTAVILLVVGDGFSYRETAVLRDPAGRAVGEADENGDVIQIFKADPGNVCRLSGRERFRR